MTRTSFKRPEKKKIINPVWRGLGCLLGVTIFITAFAISNWFISAVTDRENPLPLPPQLKVLPGAFLQMRAQFGEMVPIILTPEIGRIGKYIPELLLSTVVAVIIFGLITAIYSLFRGDVNDSRDARKFMVEGRKKRNVRKCR